MTPADYAAKLGCGAKKVLSWIASGDLHAINIGDGSKPRWLIPIESAEQFELLRSNTQPSRSQRRHRKSTAPSRY